MYENNSEMKELQESMLKYLSIFDENTSKDKKLEEINQYYLSLHQFFESMQDHLITISPISKTLVKIKMMERSCNLNLNSKTESDNEILVNDMRSLISEVQLLFQSIKTYDPEFEDIDRKRLLIQKLKDLALMGKNKSNNPKSISGKDLYQHIQNIIYCTVDYLNQSNQVKMLYKLIENTFQIRYKSQDILSSLKKPIDHNDLLEHHLIARGYMVGIKISMQGKKKKKKN